MTPTIRHAQPSDLDAIVDFIRLYWRENHIFVRNAAFFQYDLMRNDVPQFLLAEADGSIVGILGYMQYGMALESSDLFLVIMRVLDSHAKEGTAIRFLKACRELTTGNIHTIGANPNMFPLYKLMRYRTGFLNHYYWVNPDVEIFRIANISSSENWNVCDDPQAARLIAEVDEVEYEQLDHSSQVKKSFEYFCNRYFNHPLYNYEVYEVRYGECLKGVGIIRHVDALQSRMIRIVDWIGDEMYFASFARTVQELCLRKGSEYIDLYCSGFSSKTIEHSCFQPVTDRTPDALPNYFSPFVKQNVSISFCTTDSRTLKFFRGDGDQDRPS